MTLDNERDRIKRIDDEVLRTMKSLDSIPSLTASPHFSSRVIETFIHSDQTDQGRIVQLVFARKLAPILLIVILLANIATAWIAMKDAHNSISRDNGIESMVDQYSIDVPNPLNSISVH
jgi:hypothetical protein